MNMKIEAAAILFSVVFGAQALAQQTTPQQGASTASKQETGTTSGPAAGTNVEPSAATQKKAGTSNSGVVSAGAPGAEAAKGSEGGQAPK